MRGSTQWAVALTLLAAGCSQGDQWAPKSLNGRTETIQVTSATGSLANYEDTNLSTTYTRPSYQMLNPDGTVFGSGTYTYQPINDKSAAIDYQQLEGKMAGARWHHELQFDGPMQGTVSGSQLSGGTGHFEGRFTFL
jgi:hypothetical protein